MYRLLSILIISLISFQLSANEQIWKFGKIFINATKTVGA